MIVFAFKEFLFWQRWFSLCRGLRSNVGYDQLPPPKPRLPTTESGKTSPYLKMTENTKNNKTVVFLDEDCQRKRCQRICVGSDCCLSLFMTKGTPEPGGQQTFSLWVFGNTSIPVLETSAYSVCSSPPRQSHLPSHKWRNNIGEGAVVLNCELCSIRSLCWVFGSLLRLCWTLWNLGFRRCRNSVVQTRCILLKEFLFWSLLGLMALITCLLACLVGISPDSWTRQVWLAWLIKFSWSAWDPPLDHCSVFVVLGIRKSP